jgi:hypothetical protein
LNLKKKRTAGAAQTLKRSGYHIRIIIIILLFFSFSDIEGRQRSITAGAQALG